MPNVNFVSDVQYELMHNDREGKPIKLDGNIIDNGRPIASFMPIWVIDTYRGQKAKKGFLVLDSEKDAERIAYLRACKDCGKGFKETTYVPRETFDNGSVVTGVTTAVTQRAIDPKVIQQAIIEKTLRWSSLKQKLYKADGTPKPSAEEAELNEFTDLAKELNLQ